jgi:hypothetical protein
LEGRFFGCARSFEIASSWAIQPNELTEKYWPKPNEPLARAQQIRMLADFTRITWVPDRNLVELTVALLESGASLKHPHHARTLICEPISMNLIRELPFSLPSPDQPQLKAYPTAPEQKPSGSALAKIQELVDMIKERDELIRDLRMGGVSTAPPLPMPDTDGLLESFQFHFFEADDELRRLQAAVSKIDPKDEVRQAALKKRIEDLKAKELQWLTKLSTILAKVKKNA